MIRVLLGLLWERGRNTYVGIANETEGEGVAIFVRQEDADVEIREITFGRP